MLNEENKAKFLLLAKEFEALKEKLKLTSEDMEKIMSEIGIGTYLQDTETMAVYRIVKPKGTFIAYHDIGYQRTAVGDEIRGDVSKKDAEAAGFRLNK